MGMTKEMILQMECIRIFNLMKPKEHGLLYMNHQNPKSAISGRNLKRMGLIPGVADLTYLSEQGAVFLELKTEDGRQSENQKEWQSKVVAAGYQYYIVRSISDFCTIVGIKL
jgi:hypothetical protein